ncbi:MAG: biotin synthase BioB [Methylacidiphilales bacterium]|nr:biotin synthase BioB [Candidatus Methylacidiphilales bacterium]
MDKNITPQHILSLYRLPLNQLIWQAGDVLRKYFDSDKIQKSTLCNIKTGGCPEDCGYCGQSAHWKNVKITKEKLISIEELTKQCQEAKNNGADRFCIAAAWRTPPKDDFNKVLDMISTIHSFGLESCATLGMLTEQQATALAGVGLSYYNHNLDTSREYYPKVVSTRTYEQRLETLANARSKGIKLCCGGIIGMGETRDDRCGLLFELFKLQPESVPINQLVGVPGTPLGTSEKLDHIEFIRTIAIARILMPNSWVRISAGRDTMNDELQMLCFLAGANSLFIGDKLLTVSNASLQHDKELLSALVGT